jgi:integrase/recombinase XerC
LRCSEILDLQLKDVKLDECTATVQRGKGGKRRTVGLDYGTVELIARWLEARAQLGCKGEVLICTLSGQRIDSSYVRHLCTRLRRRALITRRVHLHGLRHRFAVDLIHDGADLLTVQRLLGHSSAATTSVYLSRLGASEAVEFARSRVWEAM